jgi:RecJ-like exonuclease
MVEEIRTQCPVCEQTGKCLVCEGKKTYTEHNVETKGSWPLKKRRNDTREVDCPSCFKTGQCQVCSGKGYIGRVIGQMETEELQRMKQGLLKTREDNKKVRDLDEEKKQFEEREKQLKSPKP